jgi:hypothetical protein
MSAGTRTARRPENFHAMGVAVGPGRVLGKDPYSAPRCSARLEQTLPFLIDELGGALKQV